MSEDNSWFRAMEPDLKIKNIEDLKKQIKNEEKRCKGRPNSIRLMRLKDLLTEFNKMSLDRFLK